MRRQRWSLFALLVSALILTQTAWAGKGPEGYGQVTQTASRLASQLPPKSSLKLSGQHLELPAGVKSTLGPITVSSPLAFNAVGIRVRGQLPNPEHARLEVNVFRRGQWSGYKQVIVDEVEVASEQERPMASKERYLGGLFLTSRNDGERLSYRLVLDGQGGAPLTISEVVVAFMDTQIAHVDPPARASGARATPQSGYPKPGVVSRAQWNAAAPQCALSYCTVTHLSVHHTAVSSDYEDYTTEQCASSVKAIQNYHMYTNGWCDIGYNYLVCRNGDLFEGRAGGDDVKGAHDGYNCGSMGLSFMGYYHSPYNQTPTTESLDAVGELFAWKADQKGIDPFGVSYYAGYGKNMDNIHGHRDVNSGTSCPGDLLYSRLDDIRGMVYEKLNGVSTPYANVSFVSFPTEVAVGVPFDLKVHYDTNLYEFGQVGKLVLDVKDTVTGKILASSVFDNSGSGVQGPANEVTFNFTLNTPNSNPLYFLAYFTYLSGNYDNRLATATTSGTPTTLTIQPWADVSIAEFPTLVTRQEPFNVTIHYDTNLYELGQKGKLILEAKDLATDSILASVTQDNNGAGIWGPSNDQVFTLQVDAAVSQIYFVSYLTYLDGDYGTALADDSTGLTPTTVAPDPMATLSFVDFPASVVVNDSYTVTVHYDTNLYLLGMRGQLVLEVIDFETSAVLDSALYDNDGQGLQGPSGDYSFTMALASATHDIYFRTYFTFLEGAETDALAEADTRADPTQVSSNASCGGPQPAGRGLLGWGGASPLALIYLVSLFGIRRRRNP